LLFFAFLVNKCFLPVFFFFLLSNVAIAKRVVSA